MAEWLSIIGIGEDGLGGISSAAKQALDQSDTVFGAARHLTMIEHHDARPWPIPFDITPLLAHRGRRVAALVSGDPFWFGAGSVLVRDLSADEWRAYPGQSVFSLMAARLGWALQTTPCMGLHARALTGLRPHLQNGVRIMATLRDEHAPAALGQYLTEQGFGDSIMHLFSRLGGPNERVIHLPADAPCPTIAAPVAAAVDIAGQGRTMPQSSGLTDDWFDNDGQITKRPVRALALSALAPRRGELLWDIGTGSGSVAVEWLLCHADNRAIGFEQNATRAERARKNARILGVGHFTVIEGPALSNIMNAVPPDAVFIGGGADDELLSLLWSLIPTGCRIVAHAVTLEAETLFSHWHAAHGGTLMRIELSHAQPLGRKRGWKAAYPVVQWQVTR